MDRKTLQGRGRSFNLASEITPTNSGSVINWLGNSLARSVFSSIRNWLGQFLARSVTGSLSNWLGVKLVCRFLARTITGSPVTGSISN